MTLDEKIKKARIYSKMLLHEKYQSPRKKITNAEYMLENSIFPENIKKISKSQGSTPLLPIIMSKNNKKDIQSISPLKNFQHLEKIENKSIFFPKITPNTKVLIERNEFMEGKTAVFPFDDETLKKKNFFLEKHEEKVFQKFPKDFFQVLNEKK